MAKQSKPDKSRAQLIASTLAKFKVAFGSSYEEANGPIVSLLPRQKLSLIDKGPSSKLWTVGVEFLKPAEDDLRKAVKDTVEELRQTERKDTTVDQLEVSNVRAEWVSNKRDKNERSPESEVEVFNHLNKDVDGDMVTIYVHGGAYIFNGLGSSRAAASRLSATSNSRVLCLEYRLAPQSAFPSPILDLLVAYLSLLYPPPGSLHAPVSASRIIFAGESCGANICLGAIQVLRHLGARWPSTPGKLSFHGSQRTVPMPAGLSLLSIAADYTYAPLPSWGANAKFDVWRGHPPFVETNFPADQVWPSQPPRADPYCTRLDLVHPLVSPCLVESWEGCCPVWIAEGEEQMLDGAKLIADTVKESGVAVQWEEYERMPHSWPLLLPMFPQSSLLWKRWGLAVRRLVEGKVEQSRAVSIGVEDLDEREVDVGCLTSLTRDEARALIWKKAESREDYVGNVGKVCKPCL